MMDKKESVTVRMASESAEKLRRYSRVENISQGKFIENLIENYNNQGNNKALENSEKDKVYYLLRYENYFLEDIDKQTREPIKYTMNGKVVYSLHSWIQIPIEDVKKILENEFGIKQDLEKYIFTYTFSIAYDVKKERYVINEMFDIRIQQSIKATLNVSRCKSVLNLYEIKKHIGVYAPTHILFEVEKFLVEETDDDGIFEKFF